MKQKYDILDISYKKEFLFSNIPTVNSGYQLFRIAHEIWESKLFLKRSGAINQIIAFVIKGEGKIRVDDTETNLNTGMVFSVGRGHDSEIYTDGNQMEIFIMAGFSSLKELFIELLGTNSFACKVRNPLAIQRLFEAILDEAEYGNPYSHEVSMHYLNILLRKIAVNRISDTPKGTQALLTFNKCRQYIDRHYEALHSSSEVASACNIVTAYLCRLFKNYEQCTPGEYLIRLKLNKANTLLLTSNLTVKTISEMLAFESPYTFSRVFKQHLGISPLHFRQKNSL